MWSGSWNGDWLGPPGGTTPPTPEITPSVPGYQLPAPPRLRVDAIARGAIIDVSVSFIPGRPRSIAVIAGKATGSATAKGAIMDAKWQGPPE